MFEIPSWLYIIPVLGFLVFVHELGHFVTAKWFGIKVTEFGFGFPPKLFGFRYGETTYTLNLIPLGGFVKMVGEEDPTEPRSFARQARWKRAIVLAAGSGMNFLVPIVIFTILFMLPHDKLVSSEVMINGIAPGSPAQEAGLRAGDTILQVDGQRVTEPEHLIDIVKDKRGVPVELVVRRGAIVTGLGSSPEFATTEAVTLVPRVTAPSPLVVEVVTDPLTQVSVRDAQRYNPEIEVGDRLVQGAIGISIVIANPVVRPETEPIWRAVPMSLETIKDILMFTKDGVTQGLSSGENPGIAGPIGIAQATGEVVDELGFAWVFQLTALLSVSLGIMNILPIPALDGGRLMFVIIEWARGGKRISPKKEGLVHMAGFIVLIGLILAVSYFDVLRILNGGSILR
jgi:regulator of sigma E protease